MIAWEIPDATKAVAALGLHGANAKLADYWLSRWRAGQPPSRNDFERPEMRPYRPAIAILELRKNKSLRCIDGGTFYHLALGYDLTGQDILAVTPEAEQKPRLARCWRLVEGAVSVSQRVFESSIGTPVSAQGIILPLSGIGPGDARYLLMHTNWRPSASELILGPVKTDTAAAKTKRIEPFGP